MLRLDERNVTSIYVACILTEDVFTEEAGLYTYHRAINISAEDADNEAIMELLRSTRYRYDLRSLSFPDDFLQEDVSGNVSVVINFDDGSHVHISFLGSKTTFSFRYYPGLVIASTDGDFFQRLVEYVVANGVE